MRFSQTILWHITSSGGNIFSFKDVCNCRYIFNDCGEFFRESFDTIIYLGNFKMRINVTFWPFFEYFSFQCGNMHESYTSMKNRLDRCKVALIFAKVFVIVELTASNLYITAVYYAANLALKRPEAFQVCLSILNKTLWTVDLTRILPFRNHISQQLNAVLSSKLLFFYSSGKSNSLVLTSSAEAVVRNLPMNQVRGSTLGWHIIKEFRPFRFLQCFDSNGTS